jgi:hypothetical protein
VNNALTARLPAFIQMPTRQAKSISKIRAERRDKKLCLDCNNPAVVKLIASTGKLKILSYCQTHLDAMSARKRKR